MKITDREKLLRQLRNSPALHIWRNYERLLKISKSFETSQKIINKYNISSTIVNLNLIDINIAFKNISSSNNLYSNIAHNFTNTVDFSKFSHLMQNMINFNQLVNIKNPATNKDIFNLMKSAGFQFRNHEFNSYAEEYDNIAANPNPKDKAKFIAYRTICVFLSCILTILHIAPIPLIASLLKDITEIYIKELGHDENIKSYLTVIQEKIVKKSLSTIDKKRDKK